LNLCSATFAQYESYIVQEVIIQRMNMLIKPGKYVHFKGNKYEVVDIASIAKLWRKW